MNDLLPLFDGEETAHSVTRPLTKTLTGSQREALRKAFAELGVTDAPGQFEIVEELTGQRISSVTRFLTGSPGNSVPISNSYSAWTGRDHARAMRPTFHFGLR